MKLFYYIGFFVFLSYSSVFSQQIAVNKLKTHVRYLSDEKLKGRSTGSQGELAAANYIAKNFKSFGLIPKGNISSYYYSYKFNLPLFEGDTVGGKQISGINVVALLDNHCDKTIIISAHYDHLGQYKNDQGVLRPFPGANDNASGVAALIELARYFSFNKKKEPFNILFIAFSGHEQDQIGIKKFLNEPTVSLNDVLFAIDLDMLGGLTSDNKLYVQGLNSFSAMDTCLLNSKQSFAIQQIDEQYLKQDCLPFIRKNIRSVSFSTGINLNYHKASDELKMLNFEGEKKIVDLILFLIEKLEQEPDVKCKTR